MFQTVAQLSMVERDRLILTVVGSLSLFHDVNIRHKDIHVMISSSSLKLVEEIFTIYDIPHLFYEWIKSDLECLR